VTTDSEGIVSLKKEERRRKRGRRKLKEQ